MIRIVYASVTGNTEKVAKYLFDKLQTALPEEVIEIVFSGESDISVFQPGNTYIVATSTWNIGQMNQYIEEMYTQLENVDLSGIQVAFIGLGDRVYGEENFCKSMKDFRKRALERGAKEIGNPLEIDGDPDDMNLIGIDGWIEQFINNLT